MSGKREDSMREPACADPRFHTSQSSGSKSCLPEQRPKTVHILVGVRSSCLPINISCVVADELTVARIWPVGGRPSRDEINNLYLPPVVHGHVGHLFDQNLVNGTSAGVRQPDIFRGGKK